MSLFDPKPLAIPCPHLSGDEPCSICVELHHARATMEALGYAPAAVEAAVKEWERHNLALNPYRAPKPPQRHQGYVRPSEAVPPTDDVRARQERLAEQEAELDRARRSHHQPWEPDDKGYHPVQVDPLLTGVARATGQTAAAVKRRKTMTKVQHDRWEGEQ